MQMVKLDPLWQIYHAPCPVVLDTVNLRQRGFTTWLIWNFGIFFYADASVATERANWVITRRAAIYPREWPPYWSVRVFGLRGVCTLFTSSKICLGSSSGAFIGFGGVSIVFSKFLRFAFAVFLTWNDFKVSGCTITAFELFECLISITPYWSYFVPNSTFYRILSGFHRTFATGAACRQGTLTPSGHLVLSHLGFAFVLIFATGVACQQGTLTPPDTWSRPFGTCICSTCWDQSFSELVVILPDYAPRKSLGTFSILLNTSLNPLVMVHGLDQFRVSFNFVQIMCFGWNLLTTSHTSYDFNTVLLLQGFICLSTAFEVYSRAIRTISKFLHISRAYLGAEIISSLSIFNASVNKSNGTVISDPNTIR